MEIFNENILSLNKKLSYFNSLVVKCITYNGIDNSCDIVCYYKNDERKFSILSLINVFHVIDHGLVKKRIINVVAQKLGHGYFHTAELLNLNPNDYYEFVIEVEDNDNVGSKKVILMAASTNIHIKEETNIFLFPNIKDW